MNSKSTLLLSIIILLFTEKSFAQKEANIWYFGNNAGVDFNSGVPVVLTNSAMSAFEGCTSIANHNGQLLFYTDGMSVWNKNHQIMFNGTGLDGNSSSTQSGVIVPQPGPNNGAIYYIFTVDAQAGNFGFRYSIVDTSLQGGLGEVTVKNVPILNPTTEKITACAKGSGELWVVTHQWNSANFYSYILDANGLNMSPVITNVGPVMNGSSDATIGYMKISPDGNRLGLSVDWTGNYVTIFDFDKATGVPSNSLTLMSGFPGAGPYGFEFSPNSQVAYAANESAGAVSHVYQWDLQAGTNAQIIASLITMGNLTNAGALQLATDGKIYLSQMGTSFLGVVNDPNTVGTGCNFVQDVVNLQSGSCNFGLPNFIQSFFLQAQFTADGLCFGDSTFFTIVDTVDVDSVQWVFDDPNSGNNTDNGWSPYHIFSDTGTYNVQLYAYFQGNYIDSDTVAITIYPLPNTHLGNDTTICTGNILVLNASFPVNSVYLWQDGSTDSTFDATAAGSYNVEVTSVNGCVSRDTLNLSLYPLPVVDLGNDTTLCDGSSLTLDVTNSGISYLWQDGSTDPTFTISTAGTYWADVTDFNSCSKIDTLVASYVPLPPIDLGNDTLICLGDTLLLDATAPGITYHWNNGSTNPTLKVYASGVYWVKIITDIHYCVNVDTFNLGVLPPPPVDLGDEIHYCFGQQAVLDATTVGGVSFLWWDGTTNVTHNVGTPGTYWVTVTNAIGCNGYDTVEVFEQPLPIVQLGPDTLLCDYATLLLDAGNPTDYHEWQDGSNTMTYLVSKSGTYTVMVEDLYGCISGDQIVITHENTPKVDLGPDSLYCYGDTIHLNAFFPDATYFWQDGSTDTTFNVSMKPGIYDVHVADQCGTATDTVRIDFHNCQSCVNVPNVFTPNSDGVNDVFLPFHDCNVVNYTLNIFNRWGQLMWLSHDIDAGWDGRHQGLSEELGTYAWYLDYENADKPGTTYHLEGYVVLVR
ncbi:MAG TPA: gliding motility-associated C-terminal domain-containing protein [Chitinophagales bacterium]|nr:gliding motility-associated C-terminal domain-containing protein [Chitinophagales bacterium]